MMRYLSLFSGIDAASVAWMPLAWECVGVSEIELFPCAVLAHHYPNVPNLGDITKITEEQIKALGAIDLVVGGFPCQDLSIAGNRKGLKDENGELTRSGLFFTAMRIVEWARPRWLVFENVPGLYSSNKGRDFAAVVGEMAGAEFDVPARGWRNTGVALGSRGLVEWSTLDAQWFGVPQRRRRIFLVRDSGHWAIRPPVLFERHSLSGASPPRREAGQDIAGSTGDGIARCLTTGESKRQDWESCTFVTHTLRADGFDASEDGTGRGTPLVPIAFAIQAGALRTNPNSGPDGIGVQADHAYTLEARSEVQAVAFAQNQLGEVRSGEVFNTLNTNSNASGRNTPMVATVAAPVEHEALYNKGFNHGGNYASTQETHAGKILRALREAVGEEAFAKWGLGILDSLQSPEILRQALHGVSIRPAAFSRSWVVHCALSRSENGSGWLLQSLREAGCERCASQGWEPSEQLAGELGAYLSELSRPGAQAARFLHDLWQASQGLGVLRQALSAVQEVGRPAGRQGQSILGSPSGRGEEGAENVLSYKVQCEVSRERVLHEARAAGEARYSRNGAVEQERSGKGWVGETPFAVRRLTVEECEFLQGFPRGYTAISWRGKHADQCPDGPRYKALGNSMAVPVMRWIGERINIVDSIKVLSEVAA